MSKINFVMYAYSSYLSILTVLYKHLFYVAIPLTKASSL